MDCEKFLNIINDIIIKYKNKKTILFKIDDNIYEEKEIYLWGEDLSKKGFIITLNNTKDNFCILDIKEKINFFFDDFNNLSEKLIIKIFPENIDNIFLKRRSSTYYSTQRIMNEIFEKESYELKEIVIKENDNDCIIEIL